MDVQHGPDRSPARPPFTESVTASAHESPSKQGLSVLLQRDAIEPGSRERMSDRGATAADRRHWFYDSKILVGAFCLFAFVAIFWQVSRFEGFQPIFTCESAKDIDRWLLTSGMDACMNKAQSPEAQAHCMRTVYVLSCMKERWR